MCDNGVSCPRGYCSTNGIVIVPLYTCDYRNSGWLPFGIGLDDFDNIVAIDDKRFAREKLSILLSRMSELLPFVRDARHARKRSTHYGRTLFAANDNAVTIIIQLADCAIFKRGKESDRDAA